MLITQLKPVDAILASAKGGIVILVCSGCSEVHFPQDETEQLVALLKKGSCEDNSHNDTDIAVSRTVNLVIATDYVCNVEHLELQAFKNKDAINDADSILVISCGIGVQTVSERFIDKAVTAVCDTLALPGQQGVTPLEYDCAGCGECYLNATGGICPITACSKGLLNGQCGGSLNGACEVDKEMQCGWERIHKRLKCLKQPDMPEREPMTRNNNVTLEI